MLKSKGELAQDNFPLLNLLVSYFPGGPGRLDVDSEDLVGEKSLEGNPKNFVKIYLIFFVEPIGQLLLELVQAYVGWIEREQSASLFDKLLVSHIDLMFGNYFIYI